MIKSKPTLWLIDPHLAFTGLLESSEYSERTVKVYTAIFNKFMRFLDESVISLKDVSITDFATFFTKEKIGQKGQYTYIIVFKRVFDHMADDGIMGDDNPAADYNRQVKIRRRGRVKKRLPTVLSDKETESLMQVLNGLKPSFSNEREKTMILLMLATGIRCSECAELKAEAVDLGANPKIRVIGKGNKERAVPLTDAITAELEHYQQLRLNEEIPGELFFANRRGQAPSPSAVYRMVNRNIKLAGIKKERRAGPHILRHTFGTRQFAAGIPPAVVKLWMGHSSLATTLIYEHVLGTSDNLKPA